MLSSIKQEHTDLLTAISRGAAALSLGAGWPEGVNVLLAEMGKVTGVSRVWIFQTIELSANHVVQDYIFEWADRPESIQIGMPRFSMFTSTFANPEYNNLVLERQKGLWHNFIVEEMDDCWLKEDLRTQNIKSMLTIPIMVDGQWWGTLGFDDCSRACNWTNDEINLLKTGACLISNAILSNRLKARLKQFEILQGITDSEAWSFDVEKQRLWCSGDLINKLPPDPNGVFYSLQGLLRLIHREDRDILTKTLRLFFDGRDTRYRRDLRMRQSGGQYRWVEIIGTLSRDEAGRPGQFAGIVVDIRKRKEREHNLLVQAETDPMTKTANRRTFEDSLHNYFKASEISGTPLSLLVLDLDHFKNVNDTLGHQAGDFVLKKFSDICRESLRERDFLARIGGEEFAILLPGTGTNTARTVGERIREKVANHLFKIDGSQLNVTVSIGSATLQDSFPDTAEDFFREADNALYSAKRKGRNLFVQARG